MGKPIRGNNGRFAGSEGEGKHKVPTPAPRVTANDTAAGDHTDPAAVAAAQYATYQARTTPETPAGPARYAGRIIAFREDNGYDDSDFYALVEEEPGQFHWIATGSTRVGGGWIAHPDATDDVKARYAAWYATRAEAAQAAQAAHEETLIKPGRTVQVRGGRKHNGAEGVVTWVGEDQYKTTRHTTHYRARIETPDGDTFYVPATYLWVRTSSGDYVEANDTVRHTSQVLPAGVSPAAYILSAYPPPRP